MSRALHHCLACEPEQPTPDAPFTLRRGLTRHDDQICALCRDAGVRTVDDEVLVPLRIGPTRQWRLLERVADPVAGPTVAEIQAGLDISGYLGPISAGRYT